MPHSISEHNKSETIKKFIDSFFGNMPLYKEKYKNILKIVYPYLTKIEKTALFKSIETEIDKLKNEKDKGKRNKLLNKSYDNILWLNKHNEEHIYDVGCKAIEVIKNSDIELNEYEHFILFLSILFHDIGNIYGRENHTKTCETVMKSLAIDDIDRIEKEQLILIASAHGGEVDGDKDTISKLLCDEETIHSNKIRPRLLASILRFADELADYSYRTEDEFFKIPEVSNIHHQYSKSLHSVIVDNRKIKLFYQLDTNDIMNKILTTKEDIFLVDEIYKRLCKMHRERIYCMNFFPYSKQISAIDVTITISSEQDCFKRKKFEFSLKQSGYPTFTPTIPIEQSNGNKMKEYIIQKLESC